MRRIGAVLALVVLVATGGCVGFVTGSEPLDVSASPAVIADDALAESGFEHAGGGARTLNETVQVLGQEREVNAEIHFNSYVRAPENASSREEARQSASTLTLVSVPGIEVAGQSINPLRLVPDDLLFSLVSERTEFDGTVVNTSTVTMLDTETESTTYRFESNGSAGLVERASVSHEGDLVVALVAYPEGGDGEPARRLLDDIDHPANASA